MRTVGQEEVTCSATPRWPVLRAWSTRFAIPPPLEPPRSCPETLSSTCASRPTARPKCPSCRTVMSSEGHFCKALTYSRPTTRQSKASCSPRRRSARHLARLRSIPAAAV
eukprot:scaffold6348_cov259-Pinguiococcus_pyrenoidosus.AAC.14